MICSPLSSFIHRKASRTPFPQTNKVGAVPERILAPITARVLRALGALHGRRLLHRDIKPANVLLTRAGDPRVADFGISATIPDATLAACHTFTGTVTYMSPERVDGLPYGLPSDVWALGLTLLEAVTGKYPYDASAGVMQLMVQVGGRGRWWVGDGGACQRWGMALQGVPGTRVGGLPPQTRDPQWSSASPGACAQVQGRACTIR